MKSTKKQTNMKMNLKRNLMVVAAVVLMAMGANAQLLWKVTSPKSDKVSYILGTHHFAPVNFLDSIPGFAQALDNAAKVYGEIDMDLMMKPETLMAMQKMMMAPADSTLDKVLTPEQMENLNRVWAKYGPEQMPAQMLPMLKPAAVSSQLAAGMAMKVLPPMDLTQGIDQTVQVRAKQAGKPVAGLETGGVPDQYADGLPDRRAGQGPDGDGGRHRGRGRQGGEAHQRLPAAGPARIGGAYP